MTTTDPTGSRTSSLSGSRSGSRSTNAALTRTGGVLGAGVAALAAWALLTGPLDLKLVAKVGTEVAEIGPVAVLVAAIIAGLGGWAVAAIIERRAVHPRRRWLQIGVLVAALSLGGPLTNAEGTEAFVGLGLLHLITASVVIPVVAMTIPAARPTTR